MTDESVTDLDIIELLLDPGGVILSANAAGARMAGWDGEPIRLLADLTHQSARAATRDLVTQAVGRGRSAGTLMVRGVRPRTVRRLQLVLTRMNTDREPAGHRAAGTGAVSLQGWDITSLSARHDRPGGTSPLDPLTGAETRSVFADRLEDALMHRWAPGQRIALLMAVVQEPADDETLPGDSVLSAVAERMMSVLRPGDRLGRTGAGEFAVICHSMTGWADLSAVVERLRSVVLTPVHSSEGDHVASLAIGAVFPDQPAGAHDSADLLLDRTSEWMSPERKPPVSKHDRNQGQQISEQGTATMEDDPERKLHSSLMSLSEVLTEVRPLTETLRQVAAFAASAIPGADGAGLTLIERHGPDTIVASADFVRSVDDLQYGIGEGPCLLAVETRTTQRSGSLSGEPRWPRFGPRAGRLGVHSALSLPLILGERVVGALNVYGRARDAFDEESASLGERFSGPAAVTTAHALLLEESRRATAKLEQALISRAVIDQAIGIIMSRTGLNSDEAFEKLRQRSQLDDAKLAVVAEQLVNQAIARARSRRGDDS